VVPPVTVTVSAAIRPIVVVIVELAREAVGGALMVYVTVLVLDPDELVAVNTCVNEVAEPTLRVTRPLDALKLTPVLGESIEIVVPTPVAVTVSSNTNPAVPAADKPRVFERVGPFG